MTTGIDLHAAFLRYSSVGRSSNIDGFAPPLTTKGCIAQTLAHGVQSFAGAIPTAMATMIGIQERLFGAELFGKIILQPRVLDVGFLLSTKTYEIQVWNTHLFEDRTLESLVITGTGGLEITGPAAMVYGPGQGQAYIATLNSTGQVTINNVATWSFTGEPSTDLIVTGTRLVTFTPQMDWTEPFRKVLSWKTQVLPSYNRTEQRAVLRSIPRYTASFRVVTLTRQDMRETEGLLFGWQARVYGVPWWPEYSPLLAAAAPGAQALQVSTVDLASFFSGGLVMLWASQQVYEVINIYTVAAGSITLQAPLIQGWPAGTRVVPVRLGRLIQDQSLARPTNWMSAGTFVFVCEGP